MSPNEAADAAAVLDQYESGELDASAAVESFRSSLASIDDAALFYRFTRYRILVGLLPIRPYSRRARRFTPQPKSVEMESWASSGRLWDSLTKSSESATSAPEPTREG